jgi:hypothetical protein
MSPYVNRSILGYVVYFFRFAFNETDLATLLNHTEKILTEKVTLACIDCVDRHESLDYSLLQLIITITSTPSKSFL